MSNATRWPTDTSGSVAFVSLPPQSIGLGLSATIWNKRTRAFSVLPMDNGGFDPVRIGAVTGDSLVIEVLERGTPPARVFAAVVPATHHPVVVRTDPESGGSRVSTRSAIRVVFSEPMAQTTGTSGVVRLLDNGRPVATTDEFGPDRLLLVLTPNAPLAYNTTYALEIDQDAVDASGETFAAPFQLSISTAERARPPIVTAKLSMFEYVDGTWMYAPRLLVSVDPTGGDAYFGRARFSVPGLGEFSACWPHERLASGSEVEMFGDSYGDWLYVVTSETRATTTSVTGVLTYYDGNDEPVSMVLTGSIVPGGLPTTYGHGWPPVSVC